jgi:membrane-bound lytic murein transglycosylase D
MRSPVEPVYDNEVEACLLRYFTYGSKETEKMLGRAIVYLPTIEHYLDLHGMPEQLKFVPMVESALVPYAVSTKGAAGLWQLVPATGSSLGLVIDESLDERKDPNRSTEAAVKYLKRLHQRFGSWEMALVAYNCGPSRLSRAIQRAGCADFTQVKPYLPKETQRYVARFLAASYLGNYFELHGLVPSFPDDQWQNSMSARVYGALSLSNISKITGLDLPTLRSLNPGFKKDNLPARSNGVFLVLPRSAWKPYLDSIHRQVLKP